MADVAHKIKDVALKAPPDDSTRTRSKRRMTPGQRAALRRGVAAAQTAPRTLFPQWLRTVLLVILWLGSIPVYVGLISPYVTYPSARSAAVGLIMFSGIAVHMWPPKTSPWRTVAWAAICSTMTGAALLGMGAGRFALVAATLVGFSIVILRINQNARKLWELFQTWRMIR